MEMQESSGNVMLNYCTPWRTNWRNPSWNKFFFNKTTRRMLRAKKSFMKYCVGSNFRRKTPFKGFPVNVGIPGRSRKGQRAIIARWTACRVLFKPTRRLLENSRCGIFLILLDAVTARGDNFMNNHRVLGLEVKNERKTKILVRVESPWCVQV